MNPITKLTIILWALYLLGVLAHILLRAGYAIRNPLNPTSTRWQFLKHNWDTFAVRTFLSSVLFGVWLNHPALLSDGLQYFKIPLNFDFPITNWTSAVFGYLADSLLDSGQSVVASLPQLGWLNTLLRGQIPAYQPLPAAEKAIVQEQAAQIQESAQKIQDVTEKPEPPKA